MSDEVEHIKKRLSESGFPLEVLIFSELKSVSKFVEHQSYYYDEDEKKTRSIDLIANLYSRDIKWSSGDPLKFFIESTLVIECKKSVKHWVFFPLEAPFRSINGQICSVLHNEYGVPLTIDIDTSQRSHRYFEPLGISSTYKVIDEDDRNHPSAIYEALMQLTKYIQYNRNLLINDKKEQTKPLKYQIFLWYPVIVFDGKMWNVYIKDGVVDRLERTNHVVLNYENKSNERNRNDDFFLIDVINPDFLDRLVSGLKEEVKSIDDFLEKDKNRISEQYNIL